jgi:hypothetical protein
VIALRAALLAIALLAGRDAAAQGVDNLLDRIDAIRSQIQLRPGGVLGIMGYNMSPDGAANALEIDRASAVSADGSSVFQLSQFGAGFTLSESFPLWLEGYMGTARYDPRAVFTGLGARRVPLRWNNITATIGVGYDIRLGEYLWLRPILNLAGGYAASDASLFGGFLEWRFGADVPELTDKHVNAWGFGGSLMLAYYDHRPARDIDVELRYTQLRLATFGDTLREARGTSDAITLGALPLADGDRGLRPAGALGGGWQFQHLSGRPARHHGVCLGGQGGWGHRARHRAARDRRAGAVSVARAADGAVFLCRWRRDGDFGRAWLQLLMRGCGT